MREFKTAITGNDDDDKPRAACADAAGVRCATAAPREHDTV